MRFIILLLPALMLAQAPAPKPMTDNDKVVYSLGLSIYRSLGQFDLSPAEGSSALVGRQLLVASTVPLARRACKRPGVSAEPFE